MGEKIAFAGAIVVPPIGLIAGIVAAIRSRSRRGWVHQLTSAGIVVSLIMIGLMGVGTLAADRAAAAQIAHRQLETDSVSFCSAIKTLPINLGQADLGWPQVGSTIPATLAAMQLFVDRWNSLAVTAPDGVKSSVSAVAAAATELVTADTASRLIRDASNRARMSSLPARVEVANWAAEYCN